MIGTGELIVIFLVVLLLFGGKRLPELAKSLGTGIREFKRACSASEIGDSTVQQREKPTAEESSDQPHGT